MPDSNGAAEDLHGHALQQDRRVAVLGGTGLLGAEIAHRCMELGSAVTLLARRPPDAGTLALLDGATVVVGDATDPKALAKALRGATSVVEAIGAPSPNATNEERTSELRAIDALLAQLAETEGRVGLTFLSSGGTVYGDPPSLPVDEDTPCAPLSPYGVTKLAGEEAVRAASVLGIHARILRVGNVYGARQRHDRGQGLVGTMLHAAATGSPVTVYGTGDAVRDYVDVHDVADAVVALQDVDGPLVLNVGTGMGHTILDVRKIVEAVTGVQLELRHEPERTTDVRAVVLDCARLRSLIAWKPRSLDAGIADTWERLNEVAPAHGGAPIGAA